MSNFTFQTNCEHSLTAQKPAGYREHPRLLDFSLCNMLHSVETASILLFLALWGRDSFWDFFLVMVFQFSFFGARGMANQHTNHTQPVTVKELEVLNRQTKSFAFFLLAQSVLHHKMWVQWQGLNYGSSVNSESLVLPWAELK